MCKTTSPYLNILGCSKGIHNRCSHIVRLELGQWRIRRRIECVQKFRVNHSRTDALQQNKQQQNTGIKETVVGVTVHVHDVYVALAEPSRKRLSKNRMFTYRNFNVRIVKLQLLANRLDHRCQRVFRSGINAEQWDRNIWYAMPQNAVNIYWKIMEKTQKQNTFFGCVTTQTTFLSCTRK